MLIDKVESGNAPRPLGPYSQAVRVGDLLFCSGQTGTDPATGQLVSGGVRAEAQRVMENLGAVLAAAGLGFEQVVKTTIYLANIDDYAEVNAVYGSFFSGDFPARTTIAAAALPKGAAVEIDVIARK